MSVQFLRGYWSAWRILPIAGKVLLILGYILSGVIYWAGSIATPGPNAECLTGPCTVLREQLQTAQLTAIVMIVGISLVFGLALTAINVAVPNHPDTARRLMARFDGVSTDQFWKQFSTTSIPKRPLWKTILLAFAFIILWISNGFCWVVLTRLIQPDSFGLLISANVFVTVGSALITFGVLFSKRLG